MKSIILIAPPAAGKGTLAGMLKDNLKIAHISTGDLLRDEASKDTELGKYIQEQMTSGNLVSDEVVTELLKNRLQQPDCDNGYILDGYPRNIEQANILEDLLDEMNKKVNYVFYLYIDKDLSMKRACGRLSCPNCGKIYNIYFDESKPQIENQCDDCKVSLSHRKDDNEESFQKRFDTYMEKTKPLIEYYRDKNILHEIDGGSSKVLVYEKALDILNKNKEG